jgi:regulation of enolase protein 1 (concanavalin A-like superfamily)
MNGLTPRATKPVISAHATISVRYRLNQDQSQVARVAAFPYEDITQIGMMCCSPERAGFEAEFRNFKVGAAVAPPLHI